MPYINNSGLELKLNLDPNLELAFNQLELLNSLGTCFLSEHDSVELTKVINSYVKLGFKLDISKLIEIAHKIPQVTNALKL